MKAAWALASKGRYVFPVNPRSKAPLIEGGFKSASIDFDQIEQWWSEYPDARIGIATKPSELLVIDIDRKNGVDGLYHFAKAIMKIQKDSVPQTREASTPSGGIHLYYNAPHGVRGSQGKFGRYSCPGVDIRAGDSCITAPPSPGYEWTNKMPVADLPDVLVKELRWEPDPVFSLRDAPWRDENNRTEAQSEAYAKATLRNAAERVASAGPGQRNVQLYKEAATLAKHVRARNLTQAQVIESLMASCEANGLTKSDGVVSCKKTIVSGFKAAASERR